MSRASSFPTVKDRPVTLAAVAYAERMHAGQQRGDGQAYILHPLEVATLLKETGATDRLVAAGVMHDLIEKTSATPSDLKMRFGAEVTALVLSVSDDDRIAVYSERKAALRRQVAAAGEDALALFAADKLSKVRELRREQRSPTNHAKAGRAAGPRGRRVRHYERSLALLEERLPDSPLVKDLRDELRELLAERAQIRSTR